MTDVIDQLVGIGPEACEALRRARRAQARTQSQASYDALFTAADQTGVSLTERLVLAAFVSGVHGPSAVADHYHSQLAGVAGDPLADTIKRVAEAATATGPYGRFPHSADLREEDAAGPRFEVDPTTAAALGVRLSAGLAHAHLLVFRPREASPAALAALTAAGWSTAAIVTLSQLVAFLSYQLRVAAGLQVLQEAS